jgi:hypothetical protein
MTDPRGEALQRGPYRVGEPEDEDDSATVLNSSGEAMTADEIVALLNTYSKLAVADLSFLSATAPLPADARAVAVALEIAERAPELNMSNYDHDQVAELNAAMIDLTLFLRAASLPADAPQPRHLVRRGLRPDGTYPQSDNDEAPQPARSVPEAVLDAYKKCAEICEEGLDGWFSDSFKSGMRACAKEILTARDALKGKL